jgi:hypothetical protein
VPIFPNTPEGRAEQLAYYDARKLNHLPHSLLDYHDVIHGRETPAERRAREGRATSRRRVGPRPRAREPAGTHAGQR